MTDRLPEPQWLGRLEYRWALKLQQWRRQAVIRGEAPEAIWLLEHEPVITLGRRGGEVRAAGATPVVQTNRGGLATWHGPGQLVGYLILNLAKRAWSVRETVSALESGVRTWLSAYGVHAACDPKHRGVWVENNKLCAIGLHVSRGVSTHGFAINLCCDLAAFSSIVPCGIARSGGDVAWPSCTGASTIEVHRDRRRAVGRSRFERQPSKRPAFGNRSGPGLTL